MKSLYRTSSGIVKGAVLGAALSAMSSAAFAVPATFTWAPGVPVPGSTNIGPANNIIVSDFANIPIDALGNFVEHGFLTTVQFQLSGNPVLTTGLGSTYSLYFGFSGTGTQSAPPAPGSGLSSNGIFTSLNYTLFAVPGAFPSVTVSPGSDPVLTAPGGNANAVAVAFGTLIDGTTTLTAPAGGGFSPTANIDLTLTACTAAGQGNTGFGNALCTGDESGFFVAPLPADIRLLVGNFSTTTSQATLTPTGGGTFDLQVHGGGGNLTLDIPEPASMALLGTGLVALGAIARRRKQATR